MARAKRTSIRLQKAERRAAAMGSIKPKLDMGNDMTLDEFWAAIEDMRDRQNKYNELLSTVDQLYNEMITAEKALAERSERMLNAVAVVYGRNSSEYEMAGGKRRSERRRSSRPAVDQQSVA
ncbi:hypothetical protein C7293_11425 [filamentous cyanobacterium CCT1]|nr:hypothetical protein C7293_11425 [filamentous cyanobacterium CCT1]PSN78202.1 hypothetical protein C8B47_18110 [filamentous cyanobacterium CCP4]